MNMRHNTKQDTLDPPLKRLVTAAAAQKTQECKGEADNV